MTGKGRGGVTGVQRVTGKGRGRVTGSKVGRERAWKGDRD